MERIIEFLDDMKGDGLPAKFISRVDGIIDSLQATICNPEEGFEKRAARIISAIGASAKDEPIGIFLDCFDEMIAFMADMENSEPLVMLESFVDKFYGMLLLPADEKETPIDEILDNASIPQQPCVVQASIIGLGFVTKGEAKKDNRGGAHRTRAHIDAKKARLLLEEKIGHAQGILPLNRRDRNGHVIA